MTRQEIEEWIRVHNYPQLVLSDGDVVRHLEWQFLLKSTSARLEQALERINTFIERVESEGVEMQGRNQRGMR